MIIAFTISAQRVEYGITDRLTVGAEIMFFHHDYSVTDEIEPMVETQGGIGGRFKETQYAGFELAMKYNFLSPYKDFIGLSLALSYERREKYRLDGADIEQDSFVITPLFQKDFLDDTLVFAFNPKIEFERRTSTGILEEEIAFDISAGVSYRVAPKWFIGLELRHQSDYLSPYNTEEQHYEDPELQPSNFDFTDITIGTRHQYGLYIGPTVHYAEQSWWITAGVLWQIRGGGTRRNAFIRDNRNWDEHEEVHIGLFFGYALF